MTRALIMERFVIRDVIQVPHPAGRRRSRSSRTHHALLATEQYDITHVLDAPAAIIYLGDHPVDQLLADWHLPVMRGDALITLAKQQYPAITTVLISNHAHVKAAATACGADAWLRKMDLHRLQPTITALRCRGRDHQ